MDEVFSSAGMTETFSVDGQRIRRVDFSGAGDVYARFGGFESGDLSRWSALSC